MGGPNSPQFYNLVKVALRRTDPLRHFAHAEGQKHTRIARSTLTNHGEGSQKAPAQGAPGSSKRLRELREAELVGLLIRM